MGLLLDCFRGSNTQQNLRSNNVATPDLVISLLFYFDEADASL